MITKLYQVGCMSRIAIFILFEYAEVGKEFDNNLILFKIKDRF